MLRDLIIEGKTLSVFDFDDTIAKSDSWIYIKSPNGTEKKLDSAEFAVYRPKKDEEFDFRDFDRKIRNPRLIKKTARSLKAPINHFFKTIGLDPYVVTLGNANPKLKADWIEKQINKGYDTVYFMDDSRKNVAAVLGLKKQYPDVKIIAQIA